ncbi:CxxxxCH/CxxCH domain-containing protein [Streptomyces antimycoticus]|uniref:CxxxxCH/CxxCH domain-containing protein n=1 Tax=Streptomyces antimycoticus TaxID=68175 RepID=UPI00342C1FDB
MRTALTRNAPSVRKSCSVTSCHSPGTPGKKRMVPPQLWQSMSWIACAPDSGVSITGPAS